MSKVRVREGQEVEDVKQGFIKTKAEKETMSEEQSGCDEGPLTCLCPGAHCLLRTLPFDQPAAACNVNDCNRGESERF